jgi:hypothetical protein
MRTEHGTLMGLAPVASRSALVEAWASYARRLVLREMDARDLGLLVGVPDPVYRPEGSRR